MRVDDPAVPPPVATVPAGTIAHCLRANAFEPEFCWRLGVDSLERVSAADRVDAPPPLRLPYGDIVGLRLSFAPSRIDRQRHRCVVTLRSGGTVPILSTHYVGFGRFESRAPSYDALVRGLVARVAVASPGCRFAAGKSMTVYVLEHLMLAVVAVVLAWVLLALGPGGAVVWIKLGLLVLLLPLLLRYSLENRPRRFTPEAIPAAVLPQT